jgi:hypothetical protein
MGNDLNKSMPCGTKRKLVDISNLKKLDGEHHLI